MSTALLIVVVIVGLAALVLAALLPQWLFTAYGVMVFLLVDAMTRTLSGRRWASRLVAGLAAAARGVIAGWILYLMSFLVTDFRQALAGTHMFLVVGSLLAMFPVALVLRACEVSENMTVPLEAAVGGPVVLFLRSFTTDGIFHDEAPFLVGMRARSDEEELADLLRDSPLGRFVALAQPGQKFQELGPDRLAVGDREWKEVVSDLLARSSAVILRLGASESMLWELDAVVRSGKLPRTLFLLPAAPSGEEIAQKYRDLCSRIPGQPPYPAFPLELDKDARFLFFDAEGRAHVLTDSPDKPVPAVKLLAPFWEQLGVAAPKERLRPDAVLGKLVIACFAVCFLVWYFAPRILKLN
jgi:hypothetical protein